MNTLGWFLFWPDGSYLKRILAALEQEVEGAIQRIEDAKKQKNYDWLDLVTDDECKMIEELIGLSFVAAQIHIAAVVENVKRLHRYAEKHIPNLTLETTNGEKNEILRYGVSGVLNFGFNKVEIIDAAANYYKHKDEPKLNGRTSKVLKAIGCEDLCIEGGSGISTGNFRHISEMLEVEYNKLQRLFEILSEWEIEVHTAYKKELSPHTK